jgi:type III restriction enzyme
VSTQEETTNPFFDKPILNSPYACPTRHWELDETGQPTQKINDKRRRAAFITPIPKPKKHKGTDKQGEFTFDEGKGFRRKSRNTTRTRL